MTRTFERVLMTAAVAMAVYVVMVGLGPIPERSALSMLASGPVIGYPGAYSVPTIYADPTPYKRRPTQ